MERKRPRDDWLSHPVVRSASIECLLCWVKGPARIKDLASASAGKFRTRRISTHEAARVRTPIAIARALPPLDAAATTASGALLLAQGKSSAARDALRGAVASWLGANARQRREERRRAESKRSDEARKRREESRERRKALTLTMVTLEEEGDTTLMGLLCGSSPSSRAIRLRGNR
jgi:hypothetical protein